MGIPLGFHWASIGLPLLEATTPCHLRNLDRACRALLCNMQNWSVKDWRSFFGREGTVVRGLQAWSAQNFGMFSVHGLLGLGSSRTLLPYSWLKCSHNVSSNSWLPQGDSRAVVFLEAALSFPKREGHPIKHRTQDGDGLPNKLNPMVCYTDDLGLLATGTHGADEHPVVIKTAQVTCCRNECLQ